jgi:hypothetical protein
MASTITTHVTTRIPHRHAAALRRIADREGSTPSGVIARLIAENVPHMDRAAA